MEESQLRSLSSPVFPQGLVALENLLRSRFGVEVGVDGGRIVPLDSYWDKNFLVEGLWEGKVQKFNLKLMNGFDSRNRPLFGFQKQLVDRLQAELGGERVLFPVPVASKEQEWTVFEDMPVEDGSSAPIATRLLRWVEGEQTLREAFETCAPEELPALMEQAGVLFGRMHATLCGMNAWELEAGRVPFIWSMREFPSAEPYVSVLAEKDEGLSQSCQRVFDLFRERVEPSIPFLREGPVMGDFNDANVILTSEGPGAIDFGDSRLELVVGDAAIATAYMLTSPFVQSQKASPDGWHEHLTLGSLMETVRPFVAGMVQGGLSLTETEKSVFPLFVLSRMV
jgi:Ser/Thr protein kinase RdoA (MazF antagonist)